MMTMLSLGSCVEGCAHKSAWEEEEEASVEREGLSEQRDEPPNEMVMGLVDFSFAAYLHLTKGWDPTNGDDETISVASSEETESELVVTDAACETRDVAFEPMAEPAATTEQEEAATLETITETDEPSESSMVSPELNPEFPPSSPNDDFPVSIPEEGMETLDPDCEPAEYPLNEIVVIVERERTVDASRGKEVDLEDTEAGECETSAVKVVEHDFSREPSDPAQTDAGMASSRSYLDAREPQAEEADLAHVSTDLYREDNAGEMLGLKADVDNKEKKLPPSLQHQVEKQQPATTTTTDRKALESKPRTTLLAKYKQMLSGKFRAARRGDKTKRPVNPSRAPPQKKSVPAAVSPSSQNATTGRSIKPIHGERKPTARMNSK